MGNGAVFPQFMGNTQSFISRHQSLDEGVPNIRIDDIASFEIYWYFFFGSIYVLLLLMMYVFEKKNYFFIGTGVLY